MGTGGCAAPPTRVVARGLGSGLLGDVLADPVQVVGDAGVDARPVGLSTAVTPADHARLQPRAIHLAGQGPSRVALGREGSAVAQEVGRGLGKDTGAHLAGVSLFGPGTQHVVLDNLDIVPRGQAGVVLCVADAVFHDGDLYLPQRVWRGQVYWGEGRRQHQKDNDLCPVGTPHPQGTPESG